MQKLITLLSTSIVTAEQFYISTDRVIGSSELLQNIINPIQVDSIMQHGCWCQRFDPANDYSMEGVKTTLDDLDTICRKWFNLRKPIQADDGVYVVNFEDGKLKCEQNENDETQKVCELDSRMGNSILKFMESQSDWKAKRGSFDNCKDESFVEMNKIFSGETL